jgi:transposase
VARDWRDDRIAELEAQLAERDARIAKLEAQLTAALARITELEEKLRKSSRNSGKPPSSDTPAQAADRRKKAAAITKPGGRKPGGQPGHEKFTRQLVPPERVTQHTDCIPERCERCNKPLHGIDPDAKLHQVFHLPEIIPLVFQYALHALGCPDPECGHVTVGKLPPGVPRGAFGSSVVATLAFLMGVCRLGKRPVQDVMEGLFNLRISLGAIIGCQDIASSALQSPVEEAKQAAQRATVKHCDETSWREGPKRTKVWLWTVVTKHIVVFQIHKERSTKAARALLGKIRGVLVSDRYSSYGFWTLWLRQICWSHIIRDFVAIAERGGQSQRIGDSLLEESRRLFAWWHRVRDGTLTRERFQVYVRSLKKRVLALLEEGQSCANSKTANTCTEMIKVWPAFWLFVERKGVQPTNNAAEREVRHGVLWRKISGGTHSELGSRFVERILTVVATLRRQNRSVLHFLRDACEAHLSGSESPSLLPQRTRVTTTHHEIQAAA